VSKSHLYNCNVRSRQGNIGQIGKRESFWQFSWKKRQAQWFRCALER